MLVQSLKYRNQYIMLFTSSISSVALLHIRRKLLSDLGPYAGSGAEPEHFIITENASLASPCHSTQANALCGTIHNRWTGYNIWCIRFARQCLQGTIWLRKRCLRVAQIITKPETRYEK